MTYSCGSVKKTKKKRPSQKLVSREKILSSLCGGFLFLQRWGFVFGLVGYGGWFLFCVFSFLFAFLVCKIGDSGAVVRFIGGLLDIHLRC